MQIWFPCCPTYEAMLFICISRTIYEDSVLFIARVTFCFTVPEYSSTNKMHSLTGLKGSKSPDIFSIVGVRNRFKHFLRVLVQRENKLLLRKFEFGSPILFFCQVKRTSFYENSPFCTIFTSVYWRHRGSIEYLSELQFQTPTLVDICHAWMKIEAKVRTKDDVADISDFKQCYIWLLITVLWQWIRLD